jgi:NAD-dependent DNA ligase
VLYADLMQEYSHLQNLEQAYASGAPIVSDSVYDSLKAQLLQKARTQDPASTVVRRLESAVGASVSHSSPLAKVEHTAEFGGRLKSLAAAHSATEVRAWWERNIVPHFRGGGIDNLEVVLEPKVDGLTMRATYRDGNCFQVLHPACTQTAATYVVDLW